MNTCVKVLTVFRLALVAFVMVGCSKAGQSRVQVRFNKPVEFAISDSNGNMVTKFSVVFKNAWYMLPPPFTLEAGKVNYLVTFTYTNLGSRASAFNFDSLELKANNGYLYPGSLASKSCYVWKPSGESFIEAGKIGEGGCDFRRIPTNAVPTELNGSVGKIAFRLQLPGTAIAESEVQVWTNILQNEYEPKVLLKASYITHWGKNPLLHLEYSNGSTHSEDIAIRIGGQHQTGQSWKYSSQWDRRGPIQPGDTDTLIYPVKFGPIADSCNCEMQLSPKPVGYSGFPLPGWLPEEGPQVRSVK